MYIDYYYYYYYNTRRICVQVRFKLCQKKKNCVKVIVVVDIRAVYDIVVVFDTHVRCRRGALHVYLSLYYVFKNI